MTTNWDQIDLMIFIFTSAYEILSLNILSPMKKIKWKIKDNESPTYNFPLTKKRPVTLKQMIVRGNGYLFGFVIFDFVIDILLPRK